MITKGFIESIDVSSNMCTLRLPIFEGVNNVNKIEFIAQASIPPGIYNKYSAGDIVFVGFEDNQIEQPVILGKLYLGYNREHDANITGQVSAFDLKITNKAQLPEDTQLGTTKLYDILDKLNSIDTRLAALETDVANLKYNK